MSEPLEDLPFAVLRDLHLENLGLLPIVQLLDDPWLRAYIYVKLYGRALLVQKDGILIAPDPTRLVFREVPRP